MAARAYLLEREPKHPLVFVPSDTPVSEVVGRMKRLLRGTDFEVTPLHEAMGFAFNRDNIVRKGGRPKKLDPEEEAAAAKRERPDLLTVEDQVGVRVFARIFAQFWLAVSLISTCHSLSYKHIHTIRWRAPSPPPPPAPAAAPTPGRPPSSSPAWRRRAGWTSGASATAS